VRQSDDSCTARIAIPGGQSSDTVLTLPLTTGTIVTSADVTTTLGDYATTAAVASGYVPTASTTLYNIARIGATAGFDVSATADYASAELPQSQTASTIFFPLTPLRVGASIVSYAVSGALSVGAGSDPCTVDAVLYRLPTSAPFTPVSLGAITQVAISTSQAFAPSKTLAAAHTVLANNSYFVLVTATTGASEIISILAVSVTTA
jgi:hypothetical protein